MTSRLSGTRSSAKAVAARQMTARLSTVQEASVVMEANVTSNELDDAIEEAAFTAATLRQEGKSEEADAMDGVAKKLKEQEISALKAKIARLEAM